ncbi:MAG: nitrophenyl compound nitroreductase subunit ArsF family protein [Thermoguttaceae bacterium]|nr:nitrophenyl compound nitroreductase subunit ArsF family protein [Thermoguttaceae bacterium]
MDQSLGIDPKIERPDEFVQVIYFHRLPGCDTCQKMSKYVYQTVKTRFAKEIANRRLVLRYQNFEDPKNVVLVQRLKIKSPSLAILWIKDGKPVKAKLATKIWSLAGEKEKFFDYVQEEIAAYVKELKEM